MAHVACWVPDVETAANFWHTYFDATVGPLYESKRREGFRSRFAILPDGAGAVELMSGPWVTAAPLADCIGWAHVAIALGSTEAVDELAARFRADQLLVEGPRWTGDGYYECVAKSPDGTHVEITA